MKDVKIILKEKFKRLQEKWEKTYGVNALEEDLIDILNFTKLHQDNRLEITKCFIDLVNDYREGPLEIAIFVMRELRWVEVKEAALLRKTASDDPRVWAAMNDVLAVYEDDWPDAELYKYYSRKEK